MLRIDEFLFGIEFFTKGNRLKEALMLFQELDQNKDGMLDETEMESIFTYQLNKHFVASRLDGNPACTEPASEESLGNYI